MRGRGGVRDASASRENKRLKMISPDDVSNELLLLFTMRCYKDTPSVITYAAAELLERRGSRLILPPRPDGAPQMRFRADLSFDAREQAIARVAVRCDATLSLHALHYASR